MPTTLPVNTQQVLQMGTHTEKVQQTIQSLPNVTAQQVNKEREVTDEMKRTTVQEAENTYFIEETDPQTGEKKRVRILKKKKADSEKESIESEEIVPPEGNHGGKINIRA
ncbi:MAG: hypothetical protein HOK41_00075 [Nitrospina sp.]|jgi:hypothetical protein|nr:hypothetical protein [Nitrospina sp.]